MFDSQQRRIRLLQGAVKFAVGRDPARLFVLDAAGVQVRAIGTVFSITLDADHVGVAVMEGRVAITPVQATSPIPLSAGERAFVPRGDPLMAPRVSVSAQSSNHSGVLEFENATLAEVVAAFNRVNTTKLVIGDAQPAALRLGGRFRANDIDSFLRLLESSLNVIAIRRSETKILLSRRE